MGHWSEATRGYSRHTIGRKIRTLTKVDCSTILIASCLPGKLVESVPHVSWYVGAYPNQGESRAELAKVRARLLEQAMGDPVEAYRIHRDHLIVESIRRMVRVTWREASIAALLPFAARLFHCEGREMYRITRDDDGRILRRIWADIRESSATARLISLEAMGAAREAVDAPGEALDEMYPGGAGRRIAELIRMVTE